MTEELYTIPKAEDLRFDFEESNWESLEVLVLGEMYNNNKSNENTLL